MTQCIVIQVGQAGNQIGYQFWDLALREHAYIRKQNLMCASTTEDSFSSFFHSDDIEREHLRKWHGIHRSGCKARAILIDMEEGVISQLLRGPLRDVFDSRQLITDVSGSGNNWAVGHKEYGLKYKENVNNLLRKEAEKCDFLQCFFILHSMGGGTGSGMGTSVLSNLSEEFPSVQRFVVPVYPSREDDVVISPYNAALATHQLTMFADCALPVENQALINICNQVSKALPCNAYNTGKTPTNISLKQESVFTSSLGVSAKHCKEKPFDQMNNIVANLLLNITSFSRFPGSLNMDLNELVVNLVPYRQLHFLVSSFAPVNALANGEILLRGIDNMFSEAFSPYHYLLETNPKSGLYLSCALMLRGQGQLYDIRRNLNRLTHGLNFAPWNIDRWKIGFCAVPPLGHPYSLVTLTNNTCFQQNLLRMKSRFLKLYKCKAHLHHFLKVDGMESEDFETTLSCLSTLIEDYQSLDKSTANAALFTHPRLKLFV
ncbi:tubulin epsilon chain-like isoform X1 [Tachypleus tridentatus]|uniref:tubulin epsilon chain-like isoform X1 n=3 Tax=Tachypleus tridentatus TaxID=6853 RepID=UPI003FCFD958